MVLDSGFWFWLMVSRFWFLVSCVDFGFGCCFLLSDPGRGSCSGSGLGLSFRVFGFRYVSGLWFPVMVLFLIPIRVCSFWF